MRDPEITRFTQGMVNDLLALTGPLSKACLALKQISPGRRSEDAKSSNKSEAGDIIRALRLKGNECHPANRTRPAR
jgi:hypothetical protein